MRRETSALASTRRLESDELELAPVEDEPIEAPRRADLERGAASDVRILVVPARIAPRSDADRGHEATESCATGEAWQSGVEAGRAIRRFDHVGDPRPEKWWSDPISESERDVDLNEVMAPLGDASGLAVAIAVAVDIAIEVVDVGTIVGVVTVNGPIDDTVA